MRNAPSAALVLPVALVGVAVGIAARGAGVDDSLLVPLVAVGALALAGAAVAISGRVVLGALIALCAAAVLVGAWRGTSAALPNGAGSLVADIGPDERDIAGVLADEPRPREDRLQL